MMTNLFSIFDPSTNKFMSLNWLILFLPLMLFNWPYWLLPSRMNMLWISLYKKIFMEFFNLSKKKFSSNLIIFLTIMIIFMNLNLLSLMPYIFTPSSHLSINLSLSLSLWVSFMMYGWIINTNKMFIHLLPMNTPGPLMIFMILIESISNFIRPWTLAIRLSANMLAGHLLLSLLGSTLENMPYMLILFLIQNLLMILEIAVSIIQSYVFSILSLLYFNESN
uniref:ATP synthase subunit a n=1 Tax=Seladonia aeraria TaxID=1310367 RepID=A0A7T9QQP2_9HYME|nr:ATP synthase F0 subunit 6 [Seladonia aeraria]QQS74772.1 ATP synthase subunit 6 [Seladonia aeraria]